MIERVAVKNFKSLAAVNVTLQPLTVLVGPNGAGKSNFVDALRFIRDCLVEDVQTAIDRRGGLNAVRRRSRGHPTNFGFHLSLRPSDHGRAQYSFEIAARPKGGFSVKREKCEVVIGQKGGAYEVREGEFIRPLPGVRAKLQADRLALRVVSDVDEFAPVYEFLATMQFYAVAPDRLRELQSPDPGLILKPDGSNAAAVLRKLKEENRPAFERVCQLLEVVVPGTKQVEPRVVSGAHTLRFFQDVGDRHPWGFDALNMSDGTLRILGLLLAVYQQGRVSLVAIEEPEATVHPAAAEALVEILAEASATRQIVITTHSPDLIDARGISADQIRVVGQEKGKTIIVGMPRDRLELVKQKLYSPGDLLRINELLPQAESFAGAEDRINLFKFSM